MTDLLIDTTPRCVCGQTENLTRGWCPACLPGALDDLMQWGQDRDDVAHDALARLDGIAEIIGHPIDPTTPWPWNEILERIRALAQAPGAAQTWSERLKSLHDELLTEILGPHWSGRTTSHCRALGRLREVRPSLVAAEDALILRVRNRAMET